jgi:hypothetical protein
MLAKMLSMAETIQPLVENAVEMGFWDQSSADDLGCSLKDLREANIQISRGDADFEIELLLQQKELRRQQNIIGLGESFSAFEARTAEIRIPFEYGSDGDWERILDDAEVDVLRTAEYYIGIGVAPPAFKGALRKEANRAEASEFWVARLEQAQIALVADWWNRWDKSAQRRSATEQPMGNAMRARRNPAYLEIDQCLRVIASSHPQSQKDVFQYLDGRVKTPNAEPFRSAKGWLDGFRKDPIAARAWVSKVWRQLGLPSLPRGPK